MVRGWWRSGRRRSASPTRAHEGKLGAAGGERGRGGGDCAVTGVCLPGAGRIIYWDGLLVGLGAFCPLPFFLFLGILSGLFGTLWHSWLSAFLGSFSDFIGCLAGWGYRGAPEFGAIGDFLLTFLLL